MFKKLLKQKDVHSANLLEYVGKFVPTQSLLNTSDWLLYGERLSLKRCGRRQLL